MSERKKRLFRLMSESLGESLEQLPEEGKAHEVYEPQKADNVPFEVFSSVEEEKSKNLESKEGSKSNLLLLFLIIFFSLALIGASVFIFKYIL